VQERTAARIAVTLLLLDLVITAAGLTFVVLDLGTDLGPGPSSYLSDAVLILSFTPFAVVGALIISRRPRNLIGWIFMITALGMALSTTAFDYAVYALLTNPGSLPGGEWAIRAGQAGFGLPILAFMFLFLLFPNGHLPSRRWLPVAALAVLAVAALETSEFAPTVVPFELARALDVLALCACGAAPIVRYRHAGSEERQQIKWFAFAAVPAVAVGIGPLFFNPEGLFLLAFFLAPVGVAVATWIAIFRHRLYDIDVILSKTIVYGFLAVFITIVYVLVVVVFGAIVGVTEGLSLVASAIAAVTFQPVRERAQRFANRVVYGERATPYEVLSKFSTHLGEIYSTEDVLQRMAQILAEGTGASHAVVWLRTGAELRPAASWPPDGAMPAPVAVVGDALPRLSTESRVEATTSEAPVRHRGELLGAFTVVKPPYEPLTQVESGLLDDLAGQAGLVLRNAALIADLRASRQRLVSAQDEERRKIERNLHDGAQQQLVALAVKVRLATSMVGKDEAAERRLLEEVRSETGDALETLRDLARGIYPPLLADQGLAAALSAQARKTAVPTTVESDSLGRYPRDVEAAVYFCCLEALQNVAKYAGASRAVIRLIPEENGLRFEVVDDGVGFDPSSTGYGTGLQGMSDRLEAVGGELELRSAVGHGTTVGGSLRAEAPVPIPSAPAGRPIVR
jgi:signal transduction histidine kinase